MKYLVLLIVCCPAVLQSALGQPTIGLPAIRNYNSADYQGGTGIWKVAQDKNRILYFANDDGLLTFDGSFWKLYPLPNKAAIKSLAIDDSGKVYVGGQDEVGYFQPNARTGILTYHSIKDLLPDIARQFADIWDVIVTPEGVFFRTIETIFCYKNNAIRTFDAPGGWLLITAAGGRLYAVDKVRGLQVLSGDQWISPCGQTPTAPLHITGLLDDGADTLLVTTLKEGLFTLTGSALVRKRTSIDGLLKNGLINCAGLLDKGRIALGTHSEGIRILSSTGQLIQSFSDKEGLQNNDVLTIFRDHDQDLWIGLENGMALINYASSIKYIRPSGANPTMSNAVRVFEQQLYIGTSNGLFSLPIQTSDNDLATLAGSFAEVPGTKGQIVSLEEINHDLLVGHQDGALVIRDGRAVPIPFENPQGVWGFVKAVPSGKVIAGTYTGLRQLSDVGGNWTDAGRVSDLYESLQMLTADRNNQVWASHPYRGVFNTRISPLGDSASHYRHYGALEGLPSSSPSFVFSVRNQIVVATGKGVYAFDTTSHAFMRSPLFQPIFPDSSVEYLREDGSGNIWFVSNRRVGVIDISKPSRSHPYSVIYFPELTGQTVKGNPFIYPYDSENIFIGSYGGMIHLNYARYVQPDTTIRVLLSSVKAIAEKDSLIFGGYPVTSREVMHLPNHWHSFRFAFSAARYARENNIAFSYFLEGMDKSWSDWSLRPEKDYTNLSYGTYTFYVKARDNLGHVSDPASFTFVVDPAWYQTVWAYVGYFLVLLITVALLIKWQQHRFDDHRKKHLAAQLQLQYLHSLELDRQEKGLIALQNEKLEAALQFRNNELATVTMHLVERGGILSNIREELITVIKRLSIPHLSFEFKNVFRMLTDTEKHDDEWNRFALYFDEVHNNFLSALKAKYPTLSPTDLKLCAYLRLNLSSKEIAQLLNISLKGVEISRYRIRKKFQLTPDINLHDFLIDAVRG